MKLPFDRTVVLSLARRMDRRNSIVQQAASIDLPFDFFDAVDGSLLGGKQPVIDWNADPGGLTKGVVGCFLSHRLILETALTRGDQMTLILEDDVLLPRDLNRVFQLLWAKTPTDWDILYLARSHYSSSGVYSPAAGLIPVDRMDSSFHQVYEAKQSSSAYAYAVHSRCIPRLLAHLSVIRLPIDDQLSTIEPPLKVYAYYPAIIGHLEFPSDVYEGHLD